MSFIVAILVVAAVVADTVPDPLFSPDRGVVCNRERHACYDRMGASIGLTEISLGPGAAKHLLETLRSYPADTFPGARFSPAQDVECVRETGPCYMHGKPDAALTAALYGASPDRDLRGEAPAILDAEWHWFGTRYNNDTESRPANPAHYTIRFQQDGRVGLRVDCNRAGGQYRVEDNRRITIEVKHSTRAACPPDSLERIFLRDLAEASGYFLREGRLFFDLEYDTGTMVFERP